MRRMVFDLAKGLDFSYQDSISVQLAISEALTNIAKHAYENDEDAPTIINLTLENLVKGQTGSKHKERLKIQIRDFGKKVKRPKINDFKPLKSFQSGGLGLYIMKQSIDEIYYDTFAKERGTLLTMIKYK